mgnify:FL=1
MKIKFSLADKSTQFCGYPYLIEIIIYNEI